MHRGMSSLAAGRTFILGNGLAGGRACLDFPPPPVVNPVPVINSEPDESQHDFPEVFAECVEAHTAVHAGGKPGRIECDG